MVVQKVGNNAAKPNSVCRSLSANSKDRTKGIYREQVCSSAARASCIQAGDHKSRHLKQCCPYDGKESTKKGGKSRGRVQMNTGMKKIGAPKIITKEEYNAFRKCTGPITIEDRKAALKAAEEERQRLAKESIERKEEFCRIDKERPREKCPELVQIEHEAKKRTMYVLERAQNMKLEQEEEIQKCNRIIMETKCRAIRDAQIAEKKLIEHELGEEEKRLNDMMENERRWAIKEEIQKEQEEAAKRLEFASSLIDQIKENEENRLLEFERKQEESRLINLNNIAWQQEEIAKLQYKESENARIRQNLAEGNEQLKHLKVMEEQENKVIDQRIQEYQRNKDERDAKLAEERKIDRLQKEMVKSKVASQATQSKDLQERLDELNAARIQEEVERQWRQKEKEEAQKKMKALQNLLEEREKQINNKRLMQALELERERQEFEKIVRIQKEAFCREQKKLEQKRRGALIHRSEILKQVNEKERGHIEARQKMFEEGLTIRTEAAIRKKKLRETMERKYEEMRINNMPEIYIHEVKRMIDHIQ